MKRLLPLILASCGSPVCEIAGSIRLGQDRKWFLIKDSEHSPSNIESIDSQDPRAPIVHFSCRGSKVQFLIASPDETYASRGILFGASLGLDRATILTNADSVDALLVPGSNVFIYGKVIP